MLLEIFQISQENTCVGFSFLIKLPPFLKSTCDGCFCIKLLGGPNWISVEIFKIFYCFISNSFFLWNSSFCHTVTDRVEVVLQSILYWDFCFIWCEMVWPTTWNVKYNRFWGVLTETFATFENCNAYYQNLRYWKSLITTTISSFFPHPNVFLVEVSLQLGFNVQVTCIWSVMKHHKIRLFSLHLHISANPYIDILLLDAWIPRK